MRRIVSNHGLSIVLIILFAGILALHSIVGFIEFNSDQYEHAQQGLRFRAYLGSSHFWESVAENWESEFLQMGAFVWMTCFLRQKGSAESRKLKEEQAEELEEQRKIEAEAARSGKTPWPVTKGGVVLWFYENSLWLAFALLFLISFCVHAYASFRVSIAEQREHHVAISSFGQYLHSSRLWFESLQNWQSEFLAILLMVVLSIFLRAKDSPESKPVGAAHSYTGH